MANTHPTVTPSISNDRLLGFAIVSVVPAMFWTVVLAVASHATGATLSASSLVGSGLAIASAMSVLFAALQVNPRD